ncbi:hypothetical protein OV079_51065 [Nannocystis pusilla]|uniref:Uncharacterized protein n=1 Tax=Nannocystis pusilla TaxID=889268 RepID=A0A9X3F3F4_9BACT|nr:hypothetical protein [Nannocystis pusilla]MCY1013734.1 hypothetical protein [Nannocystis pusilla]
MPRRSRSTSSRVLPTTATRHVPRTPPSAAATLTNAGYAGSPSCCACSSDSMPVSSPRSTSAASTPGPADRPCRSKNFAAPGGCTNTRSSAEWR